MLPGTVFRSLLLPLHTAPLLLVGIFSLLHGAFARRRDERSKHGYEHSIP